MTHPGRLEGKAAIINAGGLGLGEGIARKFVAEGARVLIFELNASNGERVAASLGGGANAVAFVGDVTIEADWAPALMTCLERLGRCDVVANNAGVVHRSAPPCIVRQAEYEQVMKINISPLYHSANTIQPHFKKQGHGVFVNLSSISAPRVRPNLVWCAGSKGAVSAITKRLAAEFARDGI